MTILVTGATGFVGSHLVKALFAKGHAVRALVRNPKSAKLKAVGPCEFFQWKDADPIPQAAIENVDAVIHLAGEGIADKRWTPDQKKRLRDSRIRSATALVKSLKQLNKKIALISASAIGIYPQNTGAALDEEALLGKGFLAEICKDWEGEIAKAAVEGHREVRVRIGVVLGLEGGALFKMLPIFRKGLGGVLGNGKQSMSWIHVQDLVSMILWALENKEVSGPLNGVAPEAITNKYFTNTLTEVLNVSKGPPVPKAVLKVALGEMAQVVLASQQVVPKKAVDLGFVYEYPSVKLALNEILDPYRKEKSEYLKKQQWIARPVDEVFRFFSEVKNLEVITPPWLKFEVVKASTPDIQKDTLIDYKLKIRGVPVRWQSKIESWDRGTRFVDIQTKGPYKYWHHTHTFEAFAGGTLMTDIVRFQVPMGWFGKLLIGKLVQKDVETIFKFRQEKIEELFTS